MGGRRRFDSGAYGGGHGRYDLAELRPDRFRAVPQASRQTIAYARVSGDDQKDDLEREKQVLELYSAQQGCTYGAIADPGSGMDCRSKGLKRLLDAIIDDQVGRLVISHKDRGKPSWTASETHKRCP